MIPTLELGGVVISFVASKDIEQTYEEIGGYTVLRMMDGTAVAQQHWTKLRTHLSGAGSAPPGLDALVLNQSLIMKCVAPRSIYSSSNVIALPAARRSDYPPCGQAVMPDNSQIATPLSMGGDTATLTVVSGAIGYVALYWPQINVIVTDRPRVRIDMRGATMSWDFVAEEA